MNSRIEIEFMQAQPAWAGCKEHNKQLAQYAEKQQMRIARLEGKLEQSHFQMGYIQSGLQGVQDRMQERIASSENAFKLEAEQLMQIEQEKEEERLEYAKHLASMRTDFDAFVSGQYARDNGSVSSVFLTPRGKNDSGIPQKQSVGGNSEPTEKSDSKAGALSETVAMGETCGAYSSGLRGCP